MNFFTGSRAKMSACGSYRYELTRSWGAAPPLTFVMLNPSTADAERDDPTIRRCIGFAKREQAGGLAVCNLFAYRATKPVQLFEVEDPFGPLNDEFLINAAWNSVRGGMPVVCAWGNLGLVKKANERALRIFRSQGARLVCLGKTALAQPRHPLYVAGDQSLIPFP